MIFIFSLFSNQIHQEYLMRYLMLVVLPIFPLMSIQDTKPSHQSPSLY